MFSFLKLLILLCVAVCASGEPTISFPINAQLPPVARVDEPFSYTFSSYTFRSDSSISYSLGDGPKWLSIDSEEGRLYGTPKDDDIPEGDIVGQSVEIVAKDESGQVTLNATLVVSRMKAPSVRIPISKQISGYGEYSAPSSLLSYPSTEFTYSFDPNTFDFQPDMINYYATSANSSPLPAWIKFDGPSLTFSGTTPPVESLIQPPQHFGFRLIASDVVGFSAVDIEFSIIVGSHKLSTDQPTVELNATQGKRLSYDGLTDSIKLDNDSITSTDVNISSQGMPDWLSLDSETWEIEGTPEKGDHSANFTINFRDIYEDSLTVQFIVNVATGLFRSTLDDISIKAGQNVSIDLEPYFWDPEDIDIDLIVQPKKDWLGLDGFNITGKVPISTSGKLNMTIVASSKSSDLKESESLNLNIIAATPTSTSTSSRTPASTSASTATATKTSSRPSETTSAADTALPTGEHRGLTTGELLLAIILPVIFVALLLMLLICWCIRRRRARRTYLSSNFRDKISGPVLESLRINGHAPQMQQADSVQTIGRSDGRRSMYGYSEVGSHPSTMLSPSYGSLATPDFPSSYLGEDSRGRMAPTGSMPTIEEARNSWVTVEENMAITGRHSQVSSQSGRSDTTLPESTHQLLPAPGFLSDSGGSGNSFRNGLELTIPSIDDLPNMQQRDLNQAQYAQGQGSSVPFPSPIESPLAFPSSHQSSPRLVTGLFGRKTFVSGQDGRPVSRGKAPLLQESSDSIPEVPRPSPARLSAQQRLSRPESRAWYDTDSSSGPRSLHTDPSFGPSFGHSENWRVIASSHRNVGSLSYHELVDSAPFHPNRPSSITSNNRQGGLGDRASSDLISPSQWGDAKTSIRGSFASRRELFSRSASGYSRLGTSASGNWKRESSGRKSEAGSFKAFL